MAPASAEFLALQTALAGRFSVERELGRGGMGVVYLARDVALDRPVAIKVLRPELVVDPAHRARFLREARTAAALAHPNIVPIHLVEAREDLVCFVMAFVAGETLGDRVRREGPLPPAEVARIVREVAWALGYAHGRGVIHRDIKPDNVLLEQGTGRALVTDFGIARVTDQGTMTTQGEVIGTLQYMAPEQADASATVDGRADLYALGVTAFLALTGRLPFEAGSVPALLAMHLSEPAPPVTSLRPGIPPRLAEAVGRCLAKAREARFPSAEAFADALGEVTPPVTTPVSIRDVISSARVGGSLVTLPGIVYVYAVMIRPEWAPSLGVMWAALGGVGLLGFLVSARAVVRAGHSATDVAEAVGRTTAARAEDPNAVVSREQLQTLFEQLSRPLGRVGLAVFGTGYLWMVVDGVLHDLRAGIHRAPIVAVANLFMFTIGALMWIGALRPSILFWKPDDERWLDRRKRLLRRLSERVWDNPIMRAVFRFAGLGTRPPRTAAVPEQGATEVILGRAADDLFEALPEADRDRLHEVPEVLRDLERAAAALRTRRDDLERALADVGGAGGAGSPRRGEVLTELEGARERVAEKLRTVVAALEDLRLDLLRLRVGVGSAGDITAVLAEARRVGESIRAELEGHAEVARVLREG